MPDDPRPPKRSHEITRADAAAMTRRHREQTPRGRGRQAQEGEDGGLFSKDAVLKLLSQPGAQYLRFYYGRDGGGKQGIVLVASDENLADISGDEATILDMHWPCPPWCAPGDGALNI